MSFCLQIQFLTEKHVLHYSNVRDYFVQSTEKSINFDLTLHITLEYTLRNCFPKFAHKILRRLWYNLKYVNQVKIYESLLWRGLNV